MGRACPHPSVPHGITRPGPPGHLGRRTSGSPSRGRISSHHETHVLRALESTTLHRRTPHGHTTGSGKRGGRAGERGASSVGGVLRALHERIRADSWTTLRRISTDRCHGKIEGPRPSRPSWGFERWRTRAPGGGGGVRDLGSAPVPPKPDPPPRLGKRGYRDQSAHHELRQRKIREKSGQGLQSVVGFCFGGGVGGSGLTRSWKF